jgi:hypothetical protein
MDKRHAGLTGTPSQALAALRGLTTDEAFTIWRLTRPDGFVQSIPDDRRRNLRS